MHIEVAAMQPGNPGSTALGSWTLPLHPPGTEGYAAARAIYDQLDYVQRVEMYISPDGASLGKLYYAGIITGIRKGHGQNPVFELSGVSDLFWLNYSRAFPGESYSLSYGTGIVTTADYRQAHHYFGTNELGWSDTFDPFTAGNYTSTNLPALGSGAWTSTTDDGSAVVSCSTGTGAVLLAKSGAQNGSTTFHTFVEVTGRLLPSADATNAGGCGVGFSYSNGAVTNAMVGWIRAKKNGSTGHWDLDVLINSYINGALTQTTSSSALSSTEDPDGYIAFTISLLQATIGPALAVNGKVIFWPGGTPGPTNDQISGFSTVAVYPFVAFMAPASGSATAYLANLVQQYRYSDDVHSGSAKFKPGTIGTAAHSLPLYSTVDPTFLEVITRAATRENWYWRYTPQAYVLGSRTLGTIDMTTDPGTDYGTTKQVMFSRVGGSLVDAQFTGNADQIASGVTVSSVSGGDGGGIAYWRDISTMTKYGVFDDQSLALTTPNFAEQRRAATHISANKVALGAAGSKTAVVLREPQTADVWRELDRVMLHDPELGLNYIVARVIAYTFDEGQPTQTLILDQFSVDDVTLPAKRFQQAVFQTTLKFGNR